MHARSRSIYQGLIVLSLSLACGGADLHTSAYGFGTTAHQSWTARDGAPPEIVALAQTVDKYLWIGTPFGLYRFDGLKFAAYPFSPELPKLPSADISSLAADERGGLWIGFRHGGVSRLGEGGLVNYSGGPDVEGRSTDQILVRKDGSVWMVANGKIMCLHQSRWQNYGAEHGLPPEAVFTIFFDRDGNLWTSSRSYIYVLRTAENRFSRLDALKFPVTQFVQMKNGEIWISNAWYGVRPLQWNCSIPPQRLRGFANMLIDSEQRIWLGEDYQGVSIAEPKTYACNPAPPREFFTAQNGLSSDRTLSLLEDKDANIWVGSATGLDRFHSTIFKPYTRQKINFFPAIAAGKNASVWISFHGEPIMLWTEQGAKSEGPKRGSSPLYVGPDGTLWIRDPWDTRIHAYLADGQSGTQIDTPAALSHSAAQSITSDRDGSLYVAFENEGLWRYRNHQWGRLALPNLPNDTPITLLTTSDGRVWCGYSHNRIAAILGDDAQLYREPQGVRLDNVLTLHEEDGRLWAGGSNGIEYLQGHSFRTINVQQPEQLIGVSGVLIDNGGDLWANAGTGVMRIPSRERLRSSADPSYAAEAIQYTESDGILGSATQLKPNPSAIKDGHGGLWFARSDTLLNVDKPSFAKPLSPPTLDLQRVLVNETLKHASPGRTRPLLLDGGASTRLEFDFVGVDLSAPERVTYRYKLDGEDSAWRVAGDRRQAFYAHLAPGKYLFHVEASNGSEDWGRLRTPFVVEVQPAFYQTAWFRLTCLVAFGVLIWLLYLLRIQHVTSRVRDMLGQREQERLRIARELHDTLLQSIHALMLHFHFATAALPADSSARPRLERALERADALILEGRNRVQDLRGEHEGAESFSETLSRMVRGLNQDAAVMIHISEEGSPKLIQPAIRNEICSIMRESVVNALAHARATHVYLEVTYNRRFFRIVCKDDGVGMPESVVSEGGKVGHWGLRGMKERAQSIHGTLDLWSTPGKGTEVEVTIPASISYEHVSGLFLGIGKLARKLLYLKRQLQ